MSSASAFLLRHAQLQGTAFVRTITTNATHAVLAVKMKHLNDSKDFGAVLTLFDRCNDQEKRLSRVVVQALKACAQLGDLERGKAIHKTLVDTSLADSYIQAVLIQLYSKLINKSKVNATR